MTSRMQFSQAFLFTGMSLLITMSTYAFGQSIGHPIPFTFLEFAGVWFNYACVILTSRENIWCWPIGVIGCALFGVLFWRQGLYASAFLNTAYFLPMQFWGWRQWLWGAKDTGRVPSWLSNKFRLINLPAIILGAWACTNLVNHYFGGQMSDWDSAIMVLSITAQCLLTFKKLESWLFWMAVNVLAVYVYGTSGLYVVAFQYFLFLGNAIYGMVSWLETKHAHQLADWLREMREPEESIEAFLKRQRGAGG